MLSLNVFVPHRANIQRTLLATVLCAAIPATLVDVSVALTVLCTFIALGLIATMDFGTRFLAERNRKIRESVLLYGNAMQALLLLLVAEITTRFGNDDSLQWLAATTSAGAVLYWLLSSRSELAAKNEGVTLTVLLDADAKKKLERTYVTHAGRWRTAFFFCLGGVLLLSTMIALAGLRDSKWSSLGGARYAWTCVWLLASWIPFSLFTVSTKLKRGVRGGMMFYARDAAVATLSLGLFVWYRNL